MNAEDQRAAALIEALDDSHKPAIRAAADALIASAAQNNTVRAAIEQALERGRHKNLWACAYVLGHLPQPSGATIRALLAGLDHPEPDIRWALALLLVRMTTAEPNLVDLLIEICRGGSATQRRMAVYCIRDLQLSDSRSFEALRAASTDREPAIRVAAVTSLRTRKDSGGEVRRRLLELFLTDTDFRVCNAAAVCLAQRGSASAEFVAALQAAAGSGDAIRGKAAAAALALLENKRPASAGG
jgi:hypothetical protein